MKTIPKHYRLVKEHPNSYEIHDTRDEKNFHIAKKDLDLGMHAKLAKIEKFSDGGKATTPAPTPTQTPVPSPAAEMTPSQIAFSQAIKKATNYSDGGEAGDDAQPPVVVNVGQPAQSPMMSMEPPAPVANATSVATGEPINAYAPEIPAAAPAVAPQIPTIPTKPIGNSKIPLSYAQQAQNNEALGERGIKELNQADADQKEREADLLQRANTDRENRMQTYEKSRSDLEAVNNGLMQEVMKQNIDPDRWWHDRSLPGKVSSAIGVILGGLGAGLQHSTTNQALQVMQESIRQDIDAQKSDLGKKNTLLSLNLQRYRDMPAAEAATEAQMTAMLAGQMQLAAAKSGGARARANMDYGLSAMRNNYLTKKAELEQNDFKVNMLHQLNGSTPPPSAGHLLLGESAPAPIGATPGIPTPSGAAAETTAKGPEQESFLHKLFLNPKSLLFPGLSNATNVDELREKNTIHEKPIPQDPFRYGAGVNKDKLTAMKVTGLLDKEAGAKATDEYGKYTKLQNELRWADSVFDTAAQNATARGRFSRGFDMPEAGGEIGSAIKGVGDFAKHIIALGDEEDKNYNAAVDPFVGHLAKDVSGRDNPISIGQLKSVMPEEGDDLKTRAGKRAELHNLLKRSYSFPTLSEYDLIHPQDPILALDRKK